MDIFNIITFNPFIDFVHINNNGISFGMLQSIIPPWILVIIGLTITIFLMTMFLYSKKNLEKWGYVMIITGALSNILDRGINGHVIDFILLHYKDFYWPAFNFADIYITIGVMIILLQFLIDMRKKVIK